MPLLLTASIICLFQLLLGFSLLYAWLPSPRLPITSNGKLAKPKVAQGTMTSLSTQHYCDIKTLQPLWTGWSVCWHRLVGAPSALNWLALLVCLTATVEATTVTFLSEPFKRLPCWDDWVLCILPQLSHSRCPPSSPGLPTLAGHARGWHQISPGWP